MEMKLGLLLGELKAANAIDNDSCEKWCKRTGHADLDTALAAEINNPERERFVILKTRITLTSQHIQKIEKILYENTPEYKIDLFKRANKEDVMTLKKNTWDTNEEVLFNLAFGIERTMGWHEHDCEDIVIIDRNRIDIGDNEELARAIMCYLEIKYEERD